MPCPNLGTKWRGESARSRSVMQACAGGGPDKARAYWIQYCDQAESREKEIMGRPIRAGSTTRPLGLRRRSRCAVARLPFVVVCASAVVAHADVVSVPAPGAEYRVDASIGWESGGLVVKGTETIALTNTTGRPLAQLAIEWESASKEAIRVSSGGAPVELEAATPGELWGPLLLALPEAVAPGGEIQLDIAFKLRYDQFDGAHATLVKWHPRLWWGVPAHGDYEVKLDVPPELRLGTSGRRDPGAGRHIVRDARSFGLFLGKGHRVLEGDAGDVRVRVIHTPAAADCAGILLETAVDAVDFYRERFGFYPYKVLTIVPGEDRPIGGYPVATALVAMHGIEHMAEKEERYWRWITAHEVAHQYWGEHVLEGDRPGWLWIGLGLYADREYVRARGLGPMEHEAIVAQYVEAVREGFDTALTLDPAEHGAAPHDFNGAVVHGKGYSAIGALACLLGRETFDRVCRRCLQAFGGRRMGAEAFRKVCEKESDQDLDWFFEQWVESNRYLSYELSGVACVKENDRYVSRARVDRLGTLDMPVPVAAFFKDGTAQRCFTERLMRTQEVVFASRSPLVIMRLDPEHRLANVLPPP